MRPSLLIILIVTAVCVTAYTQNSPVCITKQPSPESPSDPPHAQGSIILRVQLLADGKIGTVTIVKDLVKLASTAIDAARKIEFTPKVVNGKAVAAFRQVEYSYSYGAWSVVRLPNQCGSR